MCKSAGCKTGMRSGIMTGVDLRMHGAMAMVVIMVMGVATDTPRAHLCTCSANDPSGRVPAPLANAIQWR